MKIFRIWNATRGYWYYSNNRSLWTTLSGVKKAYKYCVKNKDMFNAVTGKPDYFIIYEFELTNKKEVV